MGLPASRGWARDARAVHRHRTAARVASMKEVSISRRRVGCGSVACRDALCGRPGNSCSPLAHLFPRRRIRSSRIGSFALVPLTCTPQRGRLSNYLSITCESRQWLLRRRQRTLPDSVPWNVRSVHQYRATLPDAERVDGLPSHNPKNRSERGA